MKQQPIAVMQNNPVEAILRKEQSVAERVEAVEAAAQARLAIARDEADAMLVRARQRGEEAARQRYEAGMAQARADSLEIRRRGEAIAAEMERQGELYLEEAAQKIVAFVLPDSQTRS